jgi:membrane fusion protein, multidrug efflux system
MGKTVKILVILILIGLVLSSCSEEKAESKNMEQIYKEEGVPVKTVKVERKIFESQLTYNTVLSGIKESSASSMIGGRIEKVLVKVGDFVKKDQVIITFPMDSPSTQFFQAKVAYENSKNTFERYQKLFDVGGISAQDLDNVKTQYEVSKANWESTQKMVKVLAPISGYVTKIAVKESDNVKKETLLATISDLRNLKASIQVAEDEISDITVGTKASAEWQGNRIMGKVTQVDMAMNPRTQSFNADIVFNNTEQKIKAGITADVAIHGDSNVESITVERKNIFKRGNDFYAYVVENNIAKEKKVRLGKSSGLLAEIVDGLNENDLLIVEGQMFLEDNAKIKIIK